MSRVLLLCEGQTEQTFFDLVLRQHLALKGVYASCTMICTSRQGGRRVHRGGHARRWDLIERDLRLLLHSQSDAVTTMLDLYGFPEDMPGFPAPWPVRTVDRVDALGAAMSRIVDDPRFIPGILAHEYEGILFSDPGRIVEIVVTDPAARGSQQGSA